DRANLLCHMPLKLIEQSAVAFDAGLEGHERANRLAFDLVRFADNRSFSHFLMIYQSALDFHRADAMTGDVHHIVNPPEQPEIAVLVALAAVPGEIFSGESAPIGLYIAIRITIDRPHHRRRWFSEH